MSVKLVRPSGLIPVQDEWEALAQGLQQPHPRQPPGVPTTREPGAALQEYFHQLLPKAFIFFIPGPQISHSYPLALNLLS